MQRQLVELTEDECWERVESAVLGRLATSIGGRLHLVPVIYTAIDRSIAVRTMAGTKLHAAVSNPSQAVAFEIDDATPATHEGWSVVVVGTLEAVLDAVRTSELDRRARVSWLLGDTRGSWIQIRPTRVTGRELR